MNATESAAIVRNRLHSLQKRAEASQLLGEMLVGQARRQRAELAAAMELLTGAGAPGAVTIPTEQQPNRNYEQQV